MLMGMLASAGCGNKDTAGTGGTNTPATVASAGIEGEYIIVGGELWGEPTTKEELSKDSEAEKTIRITKGTIEMKLLGKEPEKLKYTIDATKSPAEIDIVMPGKGEKDMTSYGIYKVEGDTLTFFVWGAKEAKNRPKEFKTLKPGKDDKDQDGGMLFVVAKRK